MEEISNLMDYYLENARILKEVRFFISCVNLLDGRARRCNVFFYLIRLVFCLKSNELKVGVHRKFFFFQVQQFTF